MMSRTTSSTSGSSAMRRPVSPSCAMRTSWPSLRRLRRSPRAMARSSSMIRMRAMSGGGQEDTEGAADSQLRVQLDAPAVRLHDLLGDGEAQAGALGAAGEQVVRAVEPLEDALSVLRLDAGAVVLHLDGDVLSRAVRAQPDLLLRASVLDRI